MLPSTQTRDGGNLPGCQCACGGGSMSCGESCAPMSFGSERRSLERTFVPAFLLATLGSVPRTLAAPATRSRE